MKVVIKIGSSSIVNKNAPDFFSKESITNLLENIKNLKNATHNVYLISSGAIAIGRLINAHSLKTNSSDLELFNLGWAHLTAKYYNLCSKLQMYPMTRIITRQNLNDTLDAIQTVDGAFMPILNEDDFLNQGSPFFDNDELTYHISHILKPDLVILLTSVDGILDMQNGNLIKRLEVNNSTSFTPFTKTQDGRGGIESKVLYANKILLETGARRVVIANGLKANIIADIINQKGNYTEICTMET